MELLGLLLATGITVNMVYQEVSTRVVVEETNTEFLLDAE
jgi:hypothetical protein